MKKGSAKKFRQTTLIIRLLTPDNLHLSHRGSSNSLIDEYPWVINAYHTRVSLDHEGILYRATLDPQVLVDRGILKSSYTAI